jgi:DNA/RNA-binding domain of Phe-tRNA-synthetase-like protein
VADWLSIAPEVFGRIPGLRVVAVRAERMGPGDRSAVDARWSSAWARVHTAFGFPSPQAHPHVQAWRSAMKAAGASHKDYPTSVEALVRRALRSPEPFRVNPAVDFYNSVSLGHVAPAGGYDLDALAHPLELRLTRPGDTFEALDAPAPETVPAGEIAYTSGPSVVTRHLVWRQSRLGLVTDRTRTALFVSEVLPGQEAVAAALQDALVAGLRDLFGASTHAAVLSAGAPVLRGT